MPQDHQGSAGFEIDPLRVQGRTATSDSQTNRDQMLDFTMFCGSTEESKHDQRPASVRIRRVFAGHRDRDMTDSDGSGVDSLEHSRVSSDALNNIPTADLQGAIERALAALTAGRLDVAQNVLRDLLAPLGGTR